MGVFPAAATENFFPHLDKKKKIHASHLETKPGTEPVQQIHVIRPSNTIGSSQLTNSPQSSNRCSYLNHQNQQPNNIAVGQLVDDGEEYKLQQITDTDSL